MIDAISGSSYVPVVRQMFTEVGSGLRADAEAEVAGPSTKNTIPTQAAPPPFFSKFITADGGSSPKRIESKADTDAPSPDPTARGSATPPERQSYRTSTNPNQKKRYRFE